MRSVRREAETNGNGAGVFSIDVSGVSVLIAMPTNRDIHPETVHSLLDTQCVAYKHEIPLTVLLETGCPSLELVRSVCVHRFLQSDATKLFWIDSDMQWSADAFMRMVAISTKVKAACGAYAARSEPLKFYMNLDDGGVAANEYGCIPCRSGGLGFTIVDREVIQKLSDNAPLLKTHVDANEGQLVPQVFRTKHKDGYLISEDITFFHDIAALGYEIWCDPYLWLGHIGTKIYEGSLYNHTVAKQTAA